MDPIRISPTADPLPRGPSYFIPFEGTNPRIESDQGKADFELAVDLPPQATLHEARVYIMNNRELAGRIIEYREYSMIEIQNDPVVYAYLTKWKEKQS